MKYGTAKEGEIEYRHVCWWERAETGNSCSGGVRWHPRHPNLPKNHPSRLRRHECSNRNIFAVLYAGQQTIIYFNKWLVVWGLQEHDVQLQNTVLVSWMVKSTKNTNGFNQRSPVNHTFTALNKSFRWAWKKINVRAIFSYDVGVFAALSSIAASERRANEVPLTSWDVVSFEIKGTGETKRTDVPPQRAIKAFKAQLVGWKHAGLEWEWRLIRAAWLQVCPCYKKPSWNKSLTAEASDLFWKHLSSPKGETAWTRFGRTG